MILRHAKSARKACRQIRQSQGDQGARMCCVQAEQLLKANNAPTQQEQMLQVS
jgi:hypothetical protein